MVSCCRPSAKAKSKPTSEKENKRKSAGAKPVAKRAKLSTARSAVESDAVLREFQLAEDDSQWPVLDASDHDSKGVAATAATPNGVRHKLFGNDVHILIETTLATVPVARRDASVVDKVLLAAARFCVEGL
jgi:hypothetical protein